MTKLLHLQFLALMIPTILVLCVAAVSMAYLVLPEAPPAAVPEVSMATTQPPATEAWDDRPAQ